MFTGSAGSGAFVTATGFSSPGALSVAAGFFTGAAGFASWAYAPADTAAAQISITTLFNIGSSIPPVGRAQRRNLHFGNPIQWTHADRVRRDAALANRRDSNGRNRSQRVDCR